ncbi:MAG: hypothetical protein WAN11_00245 [Syntrophobacteraceae bacterium]
MAVDASPRLSGAGAGVALGVMNGFGELTRMFMAVLYTFLGFGLYA